MADDTKGNTIFTEVQMRDLHAFGEILKQIHYRLEAEGYIIKDGKIVPPKQKSAKI